MIPQPKPPVLERAPLEAAFIEKLCDVCGAKHFGHGRTCDTCLKVEHLWR